MDNIERTPHKMNGKVLSVKSSETLGFGFSKRVEQISQWAQRPKLDGFFLHILMGRFLDDRVDIIYYINILTM